MLEDYTKVLKQLFLQKKDLQVKARISTIHQLFDVIKVLVELYM